MSSNPSSLQYSSRGLAANSVGVDATDIMAYSSRGVAYPWMILTAFVASSVLPEIGRLNDTLMLTHGAVYTNS